jgi:polysaccharide chain length determinant protein (PEP-CTERM system associated)
MGAVESYGIRDLSKILRRRAKAIVITTGIVILGSVVVAAVLPNKYESYTTILVEPQTISERLVEAGLESSDLNNRLHLMTIQILSRSRLSKVIDEFGLYPEESEEMTREEVIELMREDVRVEPVLPELERGILSRNREIEINTFRLFFQHEEAKTSAAVANRLANDFIDQHIKERVSVSSDTEEFIDAELGHLATAIQALEARIAEVKEANAGRLPEDLMANQRMLERAVDSIRIVERELAEARSDEAFYGQQALSSAGILSPNDPVSPGRRLQALELLLNEHRSRGFTDKHPDIIAAQAEMEVLRKQLGSEEPAQDDLPLTFAQQNAEAERRRAALRVAAAQKELGRLNAQIEAIQARLAATPRVAEQLDGLQREYEHLFSSYQEFSQKGLEAGVAANMERRQKGEQFRVLEVAFAAPDPVFPNRPLIVIVSSLFGLVLGGAVAFLLESADTSFHDPRTLQEFLRIPVLASIPGILLESDQVGRRRRRVRNAFATVAIVAAVLSGALVGHVWVNGAPGWLGGGPGAAAPPVAAPPPGAQN